VYCGWAADDSLPSATAGPHLTTTPRPALHYRHPSRCRASCVTVRPPTKPPAQRPRPRARGPDWTQFFCLFLDLYRRLGTWAGLRALALICPAVLMPVGSHVTHTRPPRCVFRNSDDLQAKTVLDSCREEPPAETEKESGCKTSGNSCLSLSAREFPSKGILDAVTGRTSNTPTPCGADPCV
jgi:hypothetical protein